MQRRNNLERPRRQPVDAVRELLDPVLAAHRVLPRALGLRLVLVALALRTERERSMGGRAAAAWWAARPCGAAVRVCGGGGGAGARALV